MRAIVAIGEVVRADIARRRADAMTRPVVGVGAATHYHGAITDGVVTIQIGIVIARAVAVIVRVAIGVVSPARVARAYKKRSAVAAAIRADAITCRTTVTRVIITRAGNQAKSGGSEPKIFFHSKRVTWTLVIYSIRKNKVVFLHG